MTKKEPERIFKYISEGVIPDRKAEQPSPAQASILANIPTDFYADNGFESGADPNWAALPVAERVKMAVMYTAGRYAAAIAKSGGYME